jgi:hypothetical protein
MKTRLIVPDPEAPTSAEIGRRSGLARITNRPSTLHGIGMLCYRNGCVLSGLIFGAVRETLRAIIMITDPQKVRETLELLEREPGIEQVNHDWARI